jgi:hypothetical protein
LVRADVGAAELACGGRRRCACQGGAARHVREERRDASEKRGMARRDSDDDDDGGEERRFGGKRLSADLEGDGAYIEPQPFVTGRITNRDKRPFSLGL